MKILKTISDKISLLSLSSQVEKMLKDRGYLCQRVLSSNSRTVESVPKDSRCIYVAVYCETYKILTNKGEISVHMEENSYTKEITISIEKC